MTQVECKICGKETTEIELRNNGCLNCEILITEDTIKEYYCPKCGIQSGWSFEEEHEHVFTARSKCCQMRVEFHIIDNEELKSEWADDTLVAVVE
jgi:predicted RNA-binding Zn-ribbon protein involved in translation (DUF1610 family)